MVDERGPPSLLWLWLGGYYCDVNRGGHVSDDGVSIVVIVKVGGLK